LVERRRIFPFLYTPRVPERFGRLGNLSHFPHFYGSPGHQSALSPKPQQMPAVLRVPRRFYRPAKSAQRERLIPGVDAIGSSSESTRIFDFPRPALTGDRKGGSMRDEAVNRQRTARLAPRDGGQ